MISKRKQDNVITIFNSPLMSRKQTKKSWSYYKLINNNFLFDIKLSPVKYIHSNDKIPKIHLLRYKHI